jgi:hypothetical protein
MIILLRQHATPDEIAKVSQDLDGYIKVAVDVRQKILAAGGKRHVDIEQVLLQSGSRQEDLWGGGIDWETKGLDYDSMINIRPSQGNTSREVISSDIRKQMEELIRLYFL